MSKDLIYREDAIKALRCEYPMVPMFKSLREEWAIKTEGFRKAEEVIMELPSVDRASATEIMNAYHEGVRKGIAEAYEAYGADRPQGEWVYCEDYVGHDGYECSNCGFFIPWAYDCYADSNFILNYHTCPHCDARMKGADDE